MNKVTLVAIAASVFALAAWAGPSEDEALRESARKLDLAGVKAALAKGANPNSRSSDKRPLTPIGAVGMGVASRSTSDYQSSAVEVAKLLFSAGARVGQFDREYLFFIVSNGSVPLVSLMLDHGASATTKVEGLTLAQIALKYDQPAIYALLVSRGAVPVRADQSRQIVLVQAASMANIGGMIEALKNGARVNEPDANGATALLTALRTPIYEKRTADAIRWLLDNGADPNQKSESSLTDLDGIPLHVFVVMNTLTMKPDPKRPAVQAMTEETMLYLLKIGAKVSGMDSRGRTPLHLAAQNDNLRGAELLIQQGARVMARDGKGRTPMDFAESGPMIQLLKKNGATER